MIFNPGDILIDVSHHQGIINWAQVKADTTLNIKGAILRATQGATLLDRQFFNNVKGCEANGIPWGSYHFVTWNDENEVKDATHEAEFFTSVVKGAKGTPTIPLFVDTESDKPIPYTKDEMVIFVSTFIGVLENQKYSAGIYGGPAFMSTYYPANHPFTKYPLWVADYNGSINPVPGWKKPWLHQYTPKGMIKGISVDVDLNKIV